MKRATLFLAMILALPLAARVRAVRSGDVDTPAAWLRQRAIRIDGTLSPFLRLVSNARIVALGDATHGTHELFASKQQLVPALVDAGFRTIAFEAPYAEYAQLDDYIVHGSGDPAAALALARYWFWDAQEVFDLLMWARAQNAAGLTPPIRIAGVDPTAGAMRVVVDYLGRIDPAAAEEAQANYACMGASYRGDERCRSLIAGVRTSLASHPPSPELDEVLHAARIVEQSERVAAGDRNARDAAMAENLTWLAQRDRVVVLGHNEHWGRTDYVLQDPRPIRSAGSSLAATFGNDYFALGSALLDGTFLAVEYLPGTFDGFIGAQQMTAPSPDDFARLLAQARLDAMIVPLHAPLPPWLAGTHRMRIAGSAVPSPDAATLDLPADFGAKFDAVLYLAHSTPSLLRHWPDI
ncbi:MAG: erythromycin esterase family protein [Acidobacteria bacterium]|nr:erythromycin esterase family protein [Acidobacteriota bacterium]MBV9479112.1 erythromycin esterase family protein [Acidobacteriota bacterium]